MPGLFAVSSLFPGPSFVEASMPGKSLQTSYLFFLSESPIPHPRAIQVEMPNRGRTKRFTTNQTTTNPTTIRISPTIVFTSRSLPGRPPRYYFAQLNPDGLGPQLEPESPLTAPVVEKHERSRFTSPPHLGHATERSSAAERIIASKPHRHFSHSYS